MTDDLTEDEREEIEELGDYGKEIMRQDWFLRMRDQAEQTEAEAVESLINLVTRPLEGGELIENRFVKAAVLGNQIKDLRRHMATPEKWIEDRKELLEEAQGVEQES